MTTSENCVACQLAGCCETHDRDNDVPFHHHAGIYEPAYQLGLNDGDRGIYENPYPKNTVDFAAYEDGFAIGNNP